MGFVHHNDAITGKQRVLFDFLQQNTVGHYLYSGIFVCSIVEAHCVSTICAFVLDLVLYKLRNAHGCNAPWLGNTYDT